MRTDILFKSKGSKVVAFYYRGELLYTKTYTYDADGFVEKAITVFADGDIDIQRF